MKFHKLLKKLVLNIRQRKSLHLFMLTFFVTLAGSFGIVFFEKQHNHAINNLFDALWWSIVTITTVGYGDITPATIGGRVVAILLMAYGVGLIGMFTAAIASSILEKRLREDKGLKPIKEKNHFILCGWNSMSKEVHDEIRSSPLTKDAYVALIAQLDSRPVSDYNFGFVRGAVNEQTLEMANLKQARTVIIFSDEKLEPHARDAVTILNALTIETLKPDVYTCVEIEDEANLEHCKRARVDEIIIKGTFSSKLLARSAIHHGLSKFIEEILSSRYGPELLKVQSPKSMEGQPFARVLIETKERFNATVVAVQSKDESKFITNPSNDYIIRKGDYLIVIADKVPKIQ